MYNYKKQKNSHLRLCSTLFEPVLSNWAITRNDTNNFTNDFIHCLFSFRFIEYTLLEIVGETSFGVTKAITGNSV